MNPSAEIAAMVLARNNPMIDDIADNIGLMAGTVKQLVGKLGAQGILRREGDKVYVADRKMAETLALEADGDYSVTDNPLARAPSPSKWNPSASAVTAQTVTRPTPPATATTPAPAARPAGPKPRIPLKTDVPVKAGIPIPDPRLGRMTMPCPWPQLGTMDVDAMFEVEVPDGYEPRDVAEQIRKDIKIFDRLNPGRFFTVRAFENADKRIAVGVWRTAAQLARGSHLKAPAITAGPAPAGLDVPSFLRSATKSAAKKSTTQGKARS